MRIKYSIILLFLIALVSINTSCSPKVIYVKGDTEVQYRDSIIHQIDSVEVPVPVETIREVTPLLDPLHMEITNAVADAWVDTATNTLQGTLKSRGAIKAPVDTKIEYHYRDSIQIKEIPVPTEIEKKVYPKWLVIIAILGAAVLASEIMRFFIKS